MRLLLVLVALLACPLGWASSVTTPHGTFTFGGATCASFTSAYQSFYQSLGGATGVYFANCAPNPPAVGSGSVDQYDGGNTLINHLGVTFNSIDTADSSASGIDWGSTPHMAQALFVAVCALALCGGIKAGQMR